MVDIDFIKTTSCPICGCRTIVSESVEVDKGRVRIHCNSRKWEHRKFACGYHVEYIPNFLKEGIQGKCMFDPDEIKKKEQCKMAKESIIQQINAVDCSDEYKKRLLAAIEYVNMC